MASNERGDIYSRITADIIAAIEAGTGEFRMPWHHDGSSTARPVNVVSNKSYRGINTLALWASATQAGYAGGIWGTYQQWSAKGAQVRRGEHGTAVVFWKINDRSDEREEDREADQEDGRHRVFARAYPSVPMKVRHLAPGNLDLRALKGNHAHAHAGEAD